MYVSEDVGYFGGEPFLPGPNKKKSTPLTLNCRDNLQNRVKVTRRQSWITVLVNFTLLFGE